MGRERETVVTVVTEGLDQSLTPAGQACLVVYYGQNLGRRYFLDKAEQIIGRSDSANIQVDQDSVSRQHAKVRTQDAKAILYDLGSTNGTFVNDNPCHEEQLRDGDLIRIGQTIFKYISGSNIESKYHEEIYRLTTIDGLTQAYNKRYFLEALERELNRALRYQRTLSLAMFDIDHFKKINDTHGHLAGDYVLRELANIVSHNIRREDIFARYGGEEFSLILPEVDGEDASRVCEKLRRLIEEFDFRFAEKRIAVTSSFGIRATVKGETDVEVSEFIHDADERLYEAKTSGRNRVIV
ncbi:MAG: GGDEF domain-containing protein [Myxococcota bacterium]